MRRQAFTLIELLVVIGIVALLVGILLPTLARARRVARTTACASNFRQIGIAAHTYANDYERSVPLGPDSVSSIPGAGWNDIASAYLWLGPPDHTWHAAGLLSEQCYLQAFDVWFCPDDDTLTDPDEQIDLIGTTFARGSYVLRLRDQVSKFTIDDMGVNEAGLPARMLSLDPNVRAEGPFHHLAHEGRTVNVLYIDGHVAIHNNADDVFSVRDGEAPPVGTLPTFLRRIDQALVTADYAEAGDPADAPVLP